MADLFRVTARARDCLVERAFVDMTEAVRYAVRAVKAGWSVTVEPLPEEEAPVRVAIVE